MPRAMVPTGWLWLALACAPSLDVEYGQGVGVAPGAEACQAGLAPHDVQGEDSASPLLGQTVDVAGVVTLHASLGARRAGFFVESHTPDASPLSSEGLFVLWPVGARPAPGTRVSVRGVVNERAGMTQLESVERLDECGLAPVAPTAVEASELAHAEALEGMSICARGAWTLLDVPRSLGAGSATASPDGRLFAGGHELGGEPGQRWTLRFDAVEIPTLAPAPLPNVDGLPRLGAELDEIEGVLWVEGEARTLFVPEPPAWPSRAPSPPARAPGSSLRLVGLNLDNYFLDPDGPGARNQNELSRQRAKLVAALAALDADVLALTELENRGAEGLEHLLEGLNRALAPAPGFAFREGVAPSGSALRAGIAYRPERVRARGEAWFASTAGLRRPPVFQSFESQGFAFTLGVVHLKSKRCDAGPVVLSSSNGPSEGCGAAQRRHEAELLLEETAALREPILLLGDFNADALEAPLRLLEQGGYHDLLGTLPARERYSYVYEGRASLLDHALARGSVAERVRGAAIWHINADEPSLRSYSLDNPPEAFAADARRSSDHDPIVIDLAP